MTFDEIIAKLPKPYYQEADIAIYCQDCREILPLIPDKSIDLVLTDPPYLKKGAWWLLLPDLIKVGKGLVVTPGSWNILHWLKLEPTPFWIYCWLTYPNSRGGSASLNLGWEPILAYQRPLRPLGSDVLQYPISKQDGAGDHPHPKPLTLISKLIVHWAKENDIILDPFLGSGTTAYCAKKLNRKCIGIEIEEKYCHIAVKRLAQSVMRLEV